MKAFIRQSPDRIKTNLRPGLNRQVGPQGYLDRLHLYRHQVAMAERIECRQSTKCILISAFSNSRPEDQPGAPAYAKVYQGRQIVVFRDRLLDATERRSAPVLLGHVIAHEIVHVLQAVARYSESSLMKAHWTGRDYQEMIWKPLQVTEFDQVLILNGIAFR